MGFTQDGMESILLRRSIDIGYIYEWITECNQTERPEGHWRRWTVAKNQLRFIANVLAIGLVPARSEHQRNRPGPFTAWPESPDVVNDENMALSVLCPILVLSSVFAFHWGHFDCVRLFWVFSPCFVLVSLSVPVQMIDWKDSSSKMCCGQWRRQLVGTWARAPPWRLREFFSLGYTLKQLVWFGLVLY